MDGPGSKSEFYYQLYKTSNIISSGFFWLLCSIPIVTFGASTAAFYRILFAIRKDKKTNVKMFFSYFAESFKNASLLWLVQIITSLPIIFFGYIVFFLPENGNINIVETLPVILIALVWTAVFCYAYAYTAYFSLSVVGTVKNCFIMAFGYPSSTLPVIAMTFVSVVLVIILPKIMIAVLPVWILVMLPLIQWWKSYFIKKVFINYDDSESSEVGCE